jgi:hypothetical protein
LRRVKLLHHAQEAIAQSVAFEAERENIGGINLIREGEATKSTICAGMSATGHE